MQDWNRELVEEWSLKWDAAMAATENFSSEIRSKEAVNRHAGDDTGNFDKRMGGSTARVKTTLDAIEKRGYLKPEMKALDIGAGTGVFTLPFAEKYSSVTSLDMSVGMQAAVKRKAEALGLTNIDYRIHNWHKLDLEAENMNDAYDLVLSSINCRGICSFDSLNKMNHASRGGCCLLTWAGRSRSGNSGELQQLILGKKLLTKGGNDIIYPFNLIYNMGGEPTLEYTSISWECPMDEEEAFEYIVSSYWRFTEITEEKKELIRNYVKSHLREGKYIEKTEHLVGIMVWDAWRIKENNY